MPESVIINEIIQLKKDAFAMALRLIGEDDETFSPECYEVMKRWEPIIESFLAEERGRCV